MVYLGGSAGYIGELMTYIDNCYYFPNFKAEGRGCILPNTTWSYLYTSYSSYRINIR